MFGIKTLQENWRMIQLCSNFLKIVRAPYGDFSCIEKLSNAFTDTSNFQMVYEFLTQTEQGKRAFEEHPRLGDVNLHQLHQLPGDTLGYIYADYMLSNGFNPPPTFAANDELSYLKAHLFETHDIWHIVTGCATSKAGEIQLQGFYSAQVYPSRLWLAMLAKNLLKTAIEDVELCDQHLDALTQGWTLGKQTKPLFGIQWNTLWETPLAEIREQLNLQVPQTESRTLEIALT